MIVHWVLFCLFLLPHATRAASESATCSDDSTGTCTDSLDTAWKPHDDGSILDLDLRPIAARNMFPDCTGVGEVVSHATVQEAIANRQVRKETKDQVLVQLNGQNEGVVVTYRPGCHRSLAEGAAEALGASDKVRGPLFLFSTAGRHVSNAVAASQEAVFDQSDGILHVLLQGERWIWPGIELGFQWTVGHNVTLHTVSLDPKVILVESAVSDADATSITDMGRQNMYDSPEKHYAPGFENYRTSSTGMLYDSNPAVHALRKRAQAIARLPTLSHVEHLQFLRYTKNKWYKAHQDIFHNFDEELRQGLLLEHWMEHIAFVVMTSLEYDDQEVHSLLEPVRVWVKKERQELAKKSERSLAAVGSIIPTGLLDRPFQRAMVKALLDYATSLPVETKDWLQENYQKGSRGLLAYFVGNESEDILLLLHDCWSRAFVDFFAQRVKDQAVELSEDVSVDGIKDELLDFLLNGHGKYQLPTYSLVQPNRFCTMLPYLTDVEGGGGETVFPEASVYARELSAPEPTAETPDWCSVGLRVPAQKGNAALFYSLYPNMTKDEKSTHAGCPPHSDEGVKHAVNIFTWNVDQDFGIGFYRD